MRGGGGFEEERTRAVSFIAAPSCHIPSCRGAPRGSGTSLSGDVRGRETHAAAAPPGLDEDLGLLHLSELQPCLGPRVEVRADGDVSALASRMPDAVELDEGRGAVDGGAGGVARVEVVRVAVD